MQAGWHLLYTKVAHPGFFNVWGETLLLAFSLHALQCAIVCTYVVCVWLHGRFMGSVCADTTQPVTTVSDAHLFTTTSPGGLPTASLGHHTSARVSRDLVGLFA